MSKLYSPAKVGALQLAHRVMQAPRTRLRSEQPGDVSGDLMVDGYRQHASRVGLQIAEATDYPFLAAETADS